MKRIFVLPSFERSVKKFTPRGKSQVAESLEKFNEFVLSGDAPFGFRFKKINHDKYEFRTDIRLRVVVKIVGSDYYLVLAGNHDEVRKYLRDFRRN